MAKKLIAVRYLGFNPDGDLCTTGRQYAYEVCTRKNIKKGDFVVLADRVNNEDRNVVSTVRVMTVLDDKATQEEVDKLLEACAHQTRSKLFVGKAELGDYFAEADRKRRIEELNRKLEARFKEAEKEALYRKLAESDPEMKALIEELDSLKDKEN